MHLIAHISHAILSVPDELKDFAAGWTEIGAGYVLGGIMTFNIQGATNGTSTLIGCAAIDKGNQKAAIDLLVFSQNPSNGTYTDHSAYTANATDEGYLERIVHIQSTDWATYGTHDYCDISSIGKGLISTGGNSNVYVIAVCIGTPTPASTSDYTFRLGVYQNLK